MQLPEGSHRTSLPDKYSNGTMLFVVVGVIGLVERYELPASPPQPTLGVRV